MKRSKSSNIKPVVQQEGGRGEWRRLDGSLCGPLALVASAAIPPRGLLIVLSDPMPGAVLGAEVGLCGLVPLLGSPVVPLHRTHGVLPDPACPVALEDPAEVVLRRRAPLRCRPLVPTMPPPPPPQPGCRQKCPRPVSDGNSVSAGGPGASTVHLRDGRGAELNRPRSSSGCTPIDIWVYARGFTCAGLGLREGVRLTTSRLRRHFVERRFLHGASSRGRAAQARRRGRPPHSTCNAAGCGGGAAGRRGVPV